MARAAAAAAQAPREFLASIGTDGIPHGSRIDKDGKPAGTFLDHLSGTEDKLREWGCDEAVCLAGLFHSVYGTEGFQGFTLPLEERGSVAELIGPRAERAAFFNCVMDRSSLDTMVIEHWRRGKGPADDPAGELRCRPNAKTGFDGSERFVLSAQDLSDLIQVHLADDLEGFEHQMNKPGISCINHTLDGEEGHYSIPHQGWFGYRQQSFDAMAHILGGVILEDWRYHLSTVPPGSQPAVWVPGPPPIELESNAIYRESASKL